MQKQWGLLLDVVSAVCVSECEPLARAAWPWLWLKNCCVDNSKGFGGSGSQDKNAAVLLFPTSWQHVRHISPVLQPETFASVKKNNKQDSF